MDQLPLFGGVYGTGRGLMKIKKHKGLRVAVVVAMVLTFGPLPAVQTNLENLIAPSCTVEKRTF